MTMESANEPPRWLESANLSFGSGSVAHLGDVDIDIRFGIRFS